MKIFLAGTASRKWVLYESLPCGSKWQESDLLRNAPEEREREREQNAIGVNDANKILPFILESFYYADANTERLIPFMKDFMLDSGAFTFIENSKIKADWEGYVERYADFVNRNNVDKFFELDIDLIVGYENVLKLRSKLERLTNKQPIPVWHNNRGKDGFIRMCEEYPYVAIGGLVYGKGEYAKKLRRFFPWFINTAHKNKAKIHALGFTSLEGIVKYHFDSVDSTAWTVGNRFGFVFHFDGKTMQKIDTPKNHRIGDSRKCARINFAEWIKFQEYSGFAFSVLCYLACEAHLGNHLLTCYEKDRWRSLRVRKRIKNGRASSD